MDKFNQQNGQQVPDGTARPDGGGQAYSPVQAVGGTPQAGNQHGYGPVNKQPPQGVNTAAPQGYVAQNTRAVNTHPQAVYHTGYTPHVPVAGQQNAHYAPTNTVPNVANGQPPQANIPGGQKPKKKRRFGCLKVFSIFMVLVLGFAGYVTIRARLEANRAVELAERFITEPMLTSEDKLVEAFENGTIDANTYVQQIAYSMFEPDRVDSQYQSDVDIAFAPDIAFYLEEYFDELDEETLLYAASKLFLLDYAPQAHNEAQVENTLANLTNTGTQAQATSDTVYNDDVRTLDKYLFSPSNRFIFWYTETGSDAVSTEQVEKMAAEIDSLVAAEEKLLGISWSYSVTFQFRDLEEVGFWRIAEADREIFYTAFPIYLIESSKGIPNEEGRGVLAYYYNFLDDLGKFGAWLRNAAFWSDSVFPSVYSYPFVVMQPSAMDDWENITFIMAHELSHHFQNIAGAINKDTFIYEAHSNLIAASVVSPSSADSLPNVHAQRYTQEAEKSIFKFTGNKSYYAFLYAKAYVDVVNNGWTHMMDSMKYDNPMEYLVAKAGSQYREVMETLAVRNITQDYPSNAFLSEGFPNPALTIMPICSESMTVDASAIHYYYIQTSEARKKEMILFIDPLSRKVGSLSYCLLGGKNGSYTLLETALVDGEMSINAKDKLYKGYNELVLAVVNSSAAYDATYTIGSVTQPMLDLMNIDLEAMMLVGEDSIYMELHIDSFLEALVNLFLMFNLWDVDTGIPDLNVVLQYFVEMGNEVAGELQGAREELKQQDIQVLRLYVRALPSDDAELHNNMKKILPGIKFKLFDYEEDGVRTTAYVGYNPLQSKHAEFYMLQTFPEEGSLFYLFTVN